MENREKKLLQAYFLNAVNEINTHTQAIAELLTDLKNVLFEEENTNKIDIKSESEEKEPETVEKEPTEEKEPETEEKEPETDEDIFNKLLQNVQNIKDNIQVDPEGLSFSAQGKENIPPRFQAFIDRCNGK